MSYSVCLECKNMVGAYEKYCFKCAKDKNDNDLFFWETHDYSYLEEPKRSIELNKDRKNSPGSFIGR